MVNPYAEVTQSEGVAYLGSDNYRMKELLRFIDSAPEPFFAHVHLMGTHGICNYYTTESAQIDEDVGGARIHEVYVIGNRVETRLPGPVNSFKRDMPETAIDFKVFIDPINPVAKIALPDVEFILRQGEWSDWKSVRFPLIPTQSVPGICRFYLKEVRPEFKLYVSPVNIAKGSLGICLLAIRPHMLSGVWPGVARNFSTAPPTSSVSPSFKATCWYPAPAFALMRSGTPSCLANSICPATKSACEWDSHTPTISTPSFLAVSTNFLGDTSLPRSITSNPAPRNMMLTRFLPIS